MTAPSVSLLPCPFCNGTHISDRHVRDGRQMFCVGCGASVAPTYHGPAGDTLERARTAWNTRATQPETENEVPTLHNRRVVSNPVRAGSDGRTDGGSGDTSTGDATSGCLAAVCNDGDSAGRARITGLSATPPAPTPSAARERIAALAHRFWSIHPRELQDMGVFREEFYAQEMESLFSALLPDAAAIRAAAFEEAAGVADCLADEYDATSFTSTNAEQVGALRSKEQAAHEIAAAIRAAGEK